MTGGQLTATRARDLIGAVVGAAVVVHLLVQLGYGSLPPLPTLAGTTLLAFAAAEALLGFSMRDRIRRYPHTRPVQALTAAKAVALAKASSLAGSLVLGAWLGVLGYVAPRSDDFPAATADTITASIGAVCAAALVAAALWLEYCCRAPEDPRWEQAPGSSPR